MHAPYDHRATWPSFDDLEWHVTVGRRMRKEAAAASLRALSRLIRRAGARPSRVARSWAWLGRRR